MNGPKIVIGLSGGVDSSVAAYLLKEQGYDVLGVTMQTIPVQEGVRGEHGDLQMIEDAKKVADYLGIPHYIADFQKEFKQYVTDYFVREYLEGRTPNPCIICNRMVKWEALLSYGKKLGASQIATGHYARIDRLSNGRYALKQAASSAKDQTYALYNLTQEQLAATVMPVGQYEKEEIRAIAERAGIPVANKPDSQEICFIPDNDYARYIEKKSGKKVPEGNYVTGDGTVVGRHKGIIHYTIGQRKGLNLSMGRPVFVREIRPETNEVVVGENEDVFASALTCTKLNWMAVDKVTKGMEVSAKIRYNHKGEDCVLEPLDQGKVLCRFKRPVRAVTPGQAVVFYQNGYVAGGGIIIGKTEDTGNLV